MSTKYIVNNLTGQTLTGDLEVIGNFSVNGVTSESLVTYKALFTQTGPITATNINGFGQQFIIGETYTISIYNAPDDFSNIANVQSGTINTTGCVFIATGQTPTYWGAGSELVSNGDLVVDVLENNLGYDIDWFKTPFGGNGYYLGVNNVVGPIENAFPKNNTAITTQVTVPFNWGAYPYIDIFSYAINFTNLNSILEIDVYDYDIASQIDNALYYTPVEIKIKQDMTPVLVEGTIISSYPISNTSVNIFCNGVFNQSFYGITTSNNISELIFNLNSSPDTSYLGTYIQNGENGVSLYMYSYLKERYCPSGVSTFEVFAD